jgi:hypothetical protein
MMYCLPHSRFQNAKVLLVGTTADKVLEAVQDVAAAKISAEAKALSELHDDPSITITFCS